MAQTIGELFIKLNADTSSFEASMQKSLVATQGFVKAHEAAFRKVGMAVTAAGAAITAALGLAVKSYADAGDSALEMSQRTGLSVENIMQLDHAAKLSGTSIEGLEVGMKRMAKVIYDTANKASGAEGPLNKIGLSADKLAGKSKDQKIRLIASALGNVKDSGKKAKEMLDSIGDSLENTEKPLSDLGLSLNQLVGKKPDEQFDLIATALANIQDPTTKAALAQEMFGKSGTQLLPMLAEGAAGLEKMKKEAVDLGLVMSTDAAKKANEFNDSLTSLKGSLQGVRNTIGAALIPVLLPLIENITGVLKHIKDWAINNPGLAKGLAVVALAVGVLATVFGPLIIALPFIISGITTLTTVVLPALGVALTASTGAVGLIILAVMALVAAGVFLIKNWDMVKIVAAEVWNGILSVVEGAVNNYIRYINFLIKTVLSGINFLIQGLNKIPKVNIPEITIPQFGEVSFGRIDTAAMAQARQEKIDTKAAKAAEGMTTGGGGGVKTIEVNNPLSPEDLQKIIRAVDSHNAMTGYVQHGLKATT
jgi:TP901 family phage tail tape measure protein